MQVIVCKEAIAEVNGAQQELHQAHYTPRAHPSSVGVVRLIADPAAYS